VSWNEECEELERLVVEYSEQINRYRQALMWIMEHAGTPTAVRARCRRELGTGPQA
jgi:hypothetical protein